MTTVQITLPDQLAEDARQAGLLSPGILEEILNDQLRKRRVNELFSAMGSMAACANPALMTPEDVADEMAGLRTEKHAHPSS